MAPPASSSGTHRCSFHVEGNRLSTVAQVGRVRREGDVVMTRYLLPSTLLEFLSHAGKKVAASDYSNWAANIPLLPQQDIPRQLTMRAFRWELEYSCSMLRVDNKVGKKPIRAELFFRVVTRLGQ